ncbi:response regulator transcription factor [Chloroflexota bacterium]
MALILIIDDSSYQRRLIRKFIEIQGHQTIEATNGNEGLEMIDTHAPDCILLDLIMPEASGFELLETLQKQNSKIPAVVVTADVQASTHKQCLDLGAAAVVNKPVDSKQLRKTIEQILGPEED